MAPTPTPSTKYSLSSEASYKSRRALLEHIGRGAPASESVGTAKTVDFDKVKPVYRTKKDAREARKRKEAEQAAVAAATAALAEEPAQKLARTGSLPLSFGTETAAPQGVEQPIPATSLLSYAAAPTQYSQADTGGGLQDMLSMALGMQTSTATPASRPASYSQLPSEMPLTADTALATSVPSVYSEPTPAPPPEQVIGDIPEGVSPADFKFIFSQATTVDQAGRDRIIDFLRKKGWCLISWALDFLSLFTYLAYTATKGDDDKDVQTIVLHQEQYPASAKGAVVVEQVCSVSFIFVPLISFRTLLQIR